MIKLTKTLKDGRAVEMIAADQKQAEQLLKDPRFKLSGAASKGKAVKEGDE